MQIVITGADGFIGRNLRLRLKESGATSVVPVTRSTSDEELARSLASADFVFHLAGVNRPPDPSAFDEGNAVATQRLCDALAATGRRIPVAFTSSTQASLDNPYGRSKQRAEEMLAAYGEATGAPVYLLRLTNVFGKWARPNYNSAVATFCHNIARGLPITIHDATAPLNLIYIDDVVDVLVSLLAGDTPSGFVEAGPVYATTVGEVVEIIRAFAASRASLVTERVGTGLVRALHATYLSSLPPEDFSYPLERHSDPRGVFVEMLKTKDSGQISYFTAGPGITRGEHYHHTKAEKFLVVSGRARFGFRHVLTDERFEIVVDGTESRVVETVPGWVHKITNIGDTEMLVLLWANEIFDPRRPDTIAARVDA